MVSLAVTSSLMRAPPPLISRRASPLLVASPARHRTSKAGSPDSSSSRGMETQGRPSAAAPCSKVWRAVSCTACAASRPRHSAVASVARIFLASLVSLPSSFSRREISSSSRSVNSRRNRPTSASSVLRQYCQYSKAGSRSSLSHTAPWAVLPILAPEVAVISGEVSPNKVRLSMRRARSTPETMLPHWSDPPNCRVQSCRRASSRKS